MTFYHWAARAGLEPYERAPFQEVWNALIGGGSSPGQCAAMLDDISDFFKHKLREKRDDDF